MTSQKDQIQTLIAEIDKVLQKPSTRLPWVMSGETTQQRRVLERVRSYLVSLQQKMAVDEQFSQARTKSNLSTYDIQYQPTQATDYTRAPIAPISSSQDEAARQILQAVVQEMNQLRTSLTQPLQADLEALRQQRESLVQEIRQLEAQRQHYSLAQQQANQQKIISEFLQVLMGRLQDSLAQQVAQTLSTLQSQTPYELNPSEPIALSGRGATNQPLLNPGQRLEQLQMLQARSDQLLMSLDSTLSVVFEALQRNVQSYQESLSTGLERMHGLGQQGEVMFTALVSHLAQQLGREASSFLHSSLPTPELTAGEPSSAAPAQLASTSPTEVNSPTPPPTEFETPRVASPKQPQPPASPSTSAERIPLDLPYAGAELRRDSDRSLLPDLAPGLDPELGGVDSLEDLNLEDLDLTDVNLDDELDTLLDVDLSSAETDLATSADPLLDTLPQPSTQPAQKQPVAFPNATASASELEFLEQLDIALHQEDESAPVVSSSTADATEIGLDLEDWGGAVSNPVAEGSDATTGPMLETDDLYASLFGENDLDHSTEDVAPIELDAATFSEPTSSAIADLSATFDAVDVADVVAEPAAAAEVQPAQSNPEFASESSDLLEELTDATPETSTELLFPAETPSADVFGRTQSDETVTTLEDFLFADAPEPGEPGVDEVTPELLDSTLSSEAIAAQSAALVTPEVSEVPEALDVTDPAALSFEEFQSSFIDESESSDPLVELAELLGDAEVVEMSSSAATASTGFPSAPTQSSIEELETENERLLSELSLQDIPELSVNNAANTLEDTYVPAAPEEYLIASQDDVGDEAESSLWLDENLDENIVQQLNEDLFSWGGTEPPTTPLASLVPKSQAWDNLTLEDFVETLPETLPPVEPETSSALSSEALSNDLSTFWEDSELPSVPTETASDLTLDEFDLLVDPPAATTPAQAPAEAVLPTPQVPKQQPTELDTQDLTLDDAFVDFLEATSQLDVDSSDRNSAPSNPSNPELDAKKKIQ